jgi:hypothetical protein
LIRDAVVDVSGLHLMGADPREAGVLWQCPVDDPPMMWGGRVSLAWPRAAIDIALWDLKPTGVVDGHFVILRMLGAGTTLRRCFMSRQRTVSEGAT